MKPFIIQHPETGENIDISSFICALNIDTSPQEEVDKIDDAIRFINLNMQFDADALHGNGLQSPNKACSISSINSETLWPESLFCKK